jgi:hypothetical protein
VPGVLVLTRLVPGVLAGPRLLRLLAVLVPAGVSAAATTAHVPAVAAVAAVAEMHVQHPADEQQPEQSEDPVRVHRDSSFTSGVEPEVAPGPVRRSGAGSVS